MMAHLRRLCWLCATARALVPSPTPPPLRPRGAVRCAAADDRHDFEDAVRSAFGGEAAPLAALLAPGVRYATPVGDAASAEDALALVAEAAAFFEDARFDVLAVVGGDGAATEYRWAASATWPVKWAPRVVLHGTSSVTVDRAGGRAVAVVDSWDASPSDVFKAQVAPRFWDIYDLWATPHAERPADVAVDAFPMGKFGTATLKRTAPRLVVRASVVDVTNSRKRRVASALPDFAFLHATRDPSRGAVTTAPLTVSVETLPGAAANGTAVRERGVVWSMPLPAKFGFDPNDAALPVLPTDLADAGVDAGACVRPALEYALEPSELLLCAHFTGAVQDADAAALKAALVDAAAKAGLRPRAGDRGGPPPILHRRFRAKVGFNETGFASYATYANPPGWAAIDRDEIAIRVAAP